MLLQSGFFVLFCTRVQVVTCCNDVVSLYYFVHVSKLLHAATMWFLCIILYTCPSCYMLQRWGFFVLFCTRALYEYVVAGATMWLFWEMFFVCGKSIWWYDSRIFFKSPFENFQRGICWKSLIWEWTCEMMMRNILLTSQALRSSWPRFQGVDPSCLSYNFQIQLNVYQFLSIDLFQLK